MNDQKPQFEESDKLTLPCIVFGAAFAIWLSYRHLHSAYGTLASTVRSRELDLLPVLNSSMITLVFLGGASALASVASVVWSSGRNRTLFFVPLLFITSAVSLLILKIMNSSPPADSAPANAGYPVGQFMGLIPWIVFIICLAVASGISTAAQENAG